MNDYLTSIFSFFSDFLSTLVGSPLGECKKLADGVYTDFCLLSEFLSTLMGSPQKTQLAARVHEAC